jgi:DNA mismatch repair protein MutS
MTDEILRIESDGYPIIDIFRKKLGKIRDLEKISRQLVVKKIYPSVISSLYSSIDILREIYVILEEYPIVQSYLCDNIEPAKISIFMNEITDFLSKHLKISECSGINTLNSIERNIIQEGISEKVDKILREYSENCLLFERIREFFNSNMQNGSVDSASNDDTEYVKIHETEKSGSSLQITKKRGLVLKQILEKIAIIEDNEKVINITPDFNIPLKDIRFIKATTSNEEIEFPQLTRITNKMISQKEALSQEIGKEYLKIIGEFERRFYDSIQSLGKYVGKIDILLTKAYIAKTYHYCRPVIDTSADKSYVDIENIRHPLIEHLQQNETYVANDICIGDNKQDGVLIYGTNAVGKTSFIRAIGVAVILAQAGLYVPCSAFIFKPYTAIFSRILGNDNIFKGLSTFAVEMSELRIILKMSDENSLILGDELCSGTESESALAIFTTGLMELHKKRSTFLFATHFHEICNYEEIKSLDRLFLKHMSVHYDSQIDALVYDRLLKDGPGNRMYGLEVCKSLYLGQEFLEKAYEIRNKYYSINNGELSFGTSHFNRQKVRSICEICKVEIAEETHHLSPQRDANKDGFIETDTGLFHKNHKANLTSVCGKCHDKIHSEDIVLKKKKTTKGYILEK